MENDILKPWKKLDPETRKAVIAQIAKGEEDNRKIAAELGVSAKTVAMIRRYAQGEINLAAGKRIDGTPEVGRVAGEQCQVGRAPHPSPAAPATPSPKGEGSGKLTDHYPPDTDHCASGETVPMTIRMDGGGTRTVRISKETAEMIKQRRQQADQDKTTDHCEISEPREIWRAVEEDLWFKDVNQDRLMDLIGEMRGCIEEMLPIRQAVFEEYNRRVKLDNGEE